MTTLSYPASLPLLRLRFTLRLLEDTTLPSSKGALLRGGFGYAFQQRCCPQTCWERSEQCTFTDLCAFRWVFATPRPQGIDHLRDLRDIPRPFVIDPPADLRTFYHAGEAIEFGVVLIGRGIDALPYFLFGFEELEQLGLGHQRSKARLERVTALPDLAHDGRVIYENGSVLSGDRLPLIGSTNLISQAQALPQHLLISLRSPLRLKDQHHISHQFDLAALVRGICWRLYALSVFHSDQPWDYDYRDLVDQARTIPVSNVHMRWQEINRSSKRHSQPHSLSQGGLLGSAILDQVSETLRLVLLAGSLVHAGKACTFGNGSFQISAAPSGLRDDSRPPESQSSAHGDQE